MKKGWVFIILLILFSSPVLGVKQWSFRLTPHCTPCIEGMVVNTTLELSNTGDEPLNISGLALWDPSGIVFFNSPVYSNIAQGDKITIHFPLHLPPATRGSTLFYKPCIAIEQDTLCSENYARMFIKPLAELECSSAKDCAYDESCQNFKCMGIQCSGTVFNHKCNPITLKLILELISVILLAAITVLLVIRRQRF